MFQISTILLQVVRSPQSMAGAAATARVTVRELEGFRLGADAALCGSLVRSRVLLGPLLCPGSMHLTDQPGGHRCMPLARCAALATATHQVATIVAGIDLDSTWNPGW